MDNYIPVISDGYIVEYITSEKDTWWAPVDLPHFMTGSNWKTADGAKTALETARNSKYITPPSFIRVRKIMYTQEIMDW